MTCPVCGGVPKVNMSAISASREEKKAPLPKNEQG